MVRSLLANVWDGVNEMIDDTQHENLYGSYEWKHPTQVAGVPWKNPVATASGTFQYAAVRWFYDVSQLGAVTTKGVSPVPWEGNPGIRTAEGPSSNINAVGLQNPGVDHYLEDDLLQAQGPSTPRSSPMWPVTATTTMSKSCPS